jgi:ERF superfamily
MKQIATALVKAKKAFSPALKDKTNPAFRSKYADLGACLEAVNDALLDNGIALYQETSEDPNGVTVETVLLHESGEVIRNGKLHVPAMKQDPQGYGSALTYARRYSLMAACGIAPEDDDGNAAARAKAPSLEGQLEASIEMVAKKKDGALQVAAEEAGRGLDPQTRVSLSKLAVKVTAEFARTPGAAFDLIEEQGLNGDEKTFLWGHLDSKVRSSLKHEGQIRALADVPR